MQRCAGGPGLIFLSVPLKDFIAYARARPGELNYGSSGVGSPSHLSGELFQMFAQVKLTHVPYKGQGQAMIDLLGGHLKMAFPDVPTVADTVPGYESMSWVLMMGPAKMPAAIAGRLHKETVRALEYPDVKERLARMGSDIIGSSPDEARRFIRAELEKWSKTVKAAGIKPDQ